MMKMKILSEVTSFLNGFGYRQPAWGLGYVLMNVQAFFLGKLKVI